MLSSFGCPRSQDALKTLIQERRDARANGAGNSQKSVTLRRVQELGALFKAKVVRVRALSAVQRDVVV